MVCLGGDEAVSAIECEPTSASKLGSKSMIVEPSGLSDCKSKCTAKGSKGSGKGKCKTGLMVFCRFLDEESCKVVGAHVRSII